LKLVRKTLDMAKEFMKQIKVLHFVSHVPYLISVPICIASIVKFSSE